MALSFDTSIENVSVDLLTAQVVDYTVYGGANPARSSLANYLYLYKRSALQVDTQVTITNNDPVNANAWSFSLAGDGWYRAILFAFPIWSAGSFVLNNCVYYGGNYYKATTSTVGVPGVSPDWTLITDILAEVLNLSSSNVEIGQINNFTTANLEALQVSNALQDLGPKIRTGKCNNVNDALQVIWYEGEVDSAWFNFERGDCVEAQKIVDFITQNWAA